MQLEVQACGSQASSLLENLNRQKAQNRRARQGQTRESEGKASYLIDPKGCRPGFQFIHAQLLHLREASITHAVPQIQPGIMAQQHLATISSVPQLLRQGETWAAENPVLCHQVQSASCLRQSVQGLCDGTCCASGSARHHCSTAPGLQLFRKGRTWAAEHPVLCGQV